MERQALGVAASLLVAFVAACSDVTGPGHSPQYLLLSGVWAASTASPGGYEIKIATYASGLRITGIGVEYFLSNTDSLKISGQYSLVDSSFGLSITYFGGRTATFAGQVQGTGSLSGSWTDWNTNSSYPVTFSRLNVPPCDDSVPLLGTYDPTAPDFIVRFQDTVNATTEAARLGALYGFTATHVYEAALKGFAADIPLATVTVLRCEPKVQMIEYDGVVTTN